MLFTVFISYVFPIFTKSQANYSRYILLNKFYHPEAHIPADSCSVHNLKCFELDHFKWI